MSFVRIGGNRRGVRRGLLLSLLAVALVAGCGGDDDERDSAAPQTQQQTTTQERTGVTDKTQIREVASRYLEAYAKGDWKKVCATLSPKARARFARKGGSCVQVYKDTAKRHKTDKYMLVSRVRVDGDRATVDVSFGGSQEEKPDFKMYAAKIDGKWWLYIKRAAKGAP